MASLKFKEIEKMGQEDRKKKLKELKLELVKSKSSNKKNSRTKEIKKIIARILTINTSKKEVLNKK